MKRSLQVKKWKQIACVMAASVVANILNDPVIFQDWPYFNAGIASCLNLVFLQGYIGLT